MPKTITITAYEFSELGTDAQAKALEWMGECVNLECNEWEELSELLNTFCLEGQILSEGYLELECSDPRKTAEAILRWDPNEIKSIYGTLAQQFLAGEKIPGDFLDSLQYWLQQEYDADWDFYHSEDYLKEQIEANEYLFTEEGSRTCAL